MEDVNNFQNELTRFHLSIPDDIRLSDQSIAKYIASPERAGYVFLHTHLSVGHIDLYRFALPGIVDPNKNDILRRLPQDFVERSRKQAVAHALCTGRFCVAIQNQAESLDTEKPYLAGDFTIPHIATQSLRVFLIAMQHRIYDNLTEDTTAPLWRFQPPNESYIRSLIVDGLFRVSAPWGPVLRTCNQAVGLDMLAPISPTLRLTLPQHINNTAMFAEFNRTQKFADQSGTVGFVGPKITGVTRLPGPHYILENANHGVVEQENRTRATDAAAADRWFRGPEQVNEPSPCTPPPPEIDFESEYGPPGVPLLLAVARNAEGDQPGPQLKMYEVEKDSSMLMAERMWLSGGMRGDSVEGQYAAATGDDGPDGTGALSMLSADPDMMFPPPPHPQIPNGASVNAPPLQFMPTQPGMFMNGYAPQYTDAGAADPAAYMQQAALARDYDIQ